MSYQFIKHSVDRGVAQITLNRPDVLNSIHTAMGGELLDALSLAATDRAVRAVYLTGAGRAFCAGQDLEEATPSAGASIDFTHHVRTVYNPVVRAIRRLEKPVVCGVNGVAAGAGANLALACDIVFASDVAMFLQAFAKIGLVPDTGGTFFLPRLVGFARATALMMLAEKLPARQAQEIGLIYRVVPGDALEAEAHGLALHLATQPTCGLGLTKRALNASLTNTLDQQLDVEAEYQGLAGRTHDHAEGVAAFLAKRPPKFVGS